MNNNDIYNNENNHTNDSVNSNKELISYTKNEISHEMDILSRSFDSVRLVNPFECSVFLMQRIKQTAQLQPINALMYGTLHTNAITVHQQELL